VSHLSTPANLDLDILTRVLDDYPGDPSLRGLLRPPNGEHVLLAFEEPSTRTYLSFEHAAHNLGYSVVSFPASSSQTKGECFEDAIQNAILITEPSVVVIRSSCPPWRPTLTQKLSESYPEITFINAGNGTQHHPTQALGDLATLVGLYGSVAALRGKKLGIVGDVEFSRVARSVRDLMRAFGMEIYTPGFNAGSYEAFLAWPLETYTQITSSEMPDQCDVIMALRPQTERGSPHVDRSWLTNADLEEYPELHIMHPGPVIWAGGERPSPTKGLLHHNLKDHERVLVGQQVRNGTYMRRVLLESLDPESPYHGLIQG